MTYSSGPFAASQVPCRTGFFLQPWISHHGRRGWAIKIMAVRWEGVDHSAAATISHQPAVGQRVTGAPSLSFRGLTCDGRVGLERDCQRVCLSFLWELKWNHMFCPDLWEHENGQHSLSQDLLPRLTVSGPKGCEANTLPLPGSQSSSFQILESSPTWELGILNISWIIDFLESWINPTDTIPRRVHRAGLKAPVYGDLYSSYGLEIKSSVGIRWTESKSQPYYDSLSLCTSWGFHLQNGCINSTHPKIR